MALSAFDIAAPHYCCSCGAIGAVLCEYCKFDIESQPYDRCISCQAPSGGIDSLCRKCKVSYRRAWVCGERVGGLLRLVDLYKFEHTRAAHLPLLSLLDTTLPVVPEGCVIIPIPTIASHIRVRGGDRVARLAQSLARRRGLECRSVLSRRSQTVQHEAGRQQRIRQAREAFDCQKLNGEVCILLDDIYTTGATVEFASRTLLDAGASEVWVLVIARQPLEK